MTAIHEGGCLCRSVRYRARDEPTGAFVCHCTYCQRATGTAFRTAVAFLKDNVEFSDGPVSTYEHRSEDHGRVLRTHFCPRCGTNVGLTTKRFPAVLIINAGTFDDRNWFKISTHIFTQSAPEWIAFPPEVTCFRRHRITEDGTAEEPLPVQSRPWRMGEVSG